MSALTHLTAIVEARSGMVLGAGKEYLFEARLAPILRREGMASLDDLSGRLAKGGQRRCWSATSPRPWPRTRRCSSGTPRHSITCGRSGFRACCGERRPSAKLRIWSAAASTGQEAYSLAITLAEAGLADRDRAEILATDLASEALDRGRTTVCTPNTRCSVACRSTGCCSHFEREGQDWHVHAGLRALCRFRPWNLLDDPAPLGRFDVVFCRNVLFYFSRPARTAVLGAHTPQPGALMACCI